MDSAITLNLLAAAIGYIAGSIPFGLVLCYAAGYGDIRKIGSGNIGTTNVLRTGNKLLALLTLILDSGKGAFTVLGFTALTGASLETGILCGLGAIIGHCFPVWLGFKGGKGFATTLGTLFAAVPLAGLAAGLGWLLTAFITRISSLSALIAITIAPIAAYILYSAPAAGLCAIITALVFIRHSDNIKRILNGTETKIGQKKKSDQPVSPSQKTD